MKSISLVTLLISVSAWSSSCDQLLLVLRAPQINLGPIHIPAPKTEASKGITIQAIEAGDALRLILLPQYKGLVIQYLDDLHAYYNSRAKILITQLGDESLSAEDLETLYTQTQIELIVAQYYDEMRKTIEESGGLEAAQREKRAKFFKR